MALDALRASGLWQTYWRTLLPVTSQVRPKVLPDPSEAGAHITELHSEVETKWSGIEELEYTDEFILVIFAGLFCYWVPKRVVPEGERQALWKLLRRHVPALT